MSKEEQNVADSEFVAVFCNSFKLQYAWGMLVLPLSESLQLFSLISNIANIEKWMGLGAG